MQYVSIFSLNIFCFFLRKYAYFYIVISSFIFIDDIYPNSSRPLYRKWQPKTYKQGNVLNFFNTAVMVNAYKRAYSHYI